MYDGASNPWREVYSSLCTSGHDVVSVTRAHNKTHTVRPLSVNNFVTANVLHRALKIGRLLRQSFNLTSWAKLHASNRQLLSLGACVELISTLLFLSAQTGGNECTKLMTSQKSHTKEARTTLLCVRSIGHAHVALMRHRVVLAAHAQACGIVLGSIISNIFKVMVAFGVAPLI